MVRPLETANTTNQAAERRFDSRVILAFVAGGILLLVVFLFVGRSLLSPGESRSETPGSQRTQESDKRAVP